MMNGRGHLAINIWNYTFKNAVLENLSKSTQKLKNELIN